LRDNKIPKIPEGGAAGSARRPSLWDFIFGESLGILAQLKTRHKTLCRLLSRQHRMLWILKLVMLAYLTIEKSH
jgi:uncharacterized membrane protein